MDILQEEKLADVFSKVARTAIKENQLFFNGVCLSFGEYTIEQVPTGYGITLPGKNSPSYTVFSCLSALLICKYTTKQMTKMVNYVIMLDDNYCKHSMDCRMIKHALQTTKDDEQKDYLHLKYTNCYQLALHYHTEIHKYCRKIIMNGKY